MQYWRSFEDLERFARDSNDPHMPVFELAKATSARAVGSRETARRRLGGHNEPAVPSPE